MFFCHEILQRRNGSFGIIWLAAMQNRSLTRREYEKVHVSEKCEEIIAYIMAKVKSSGDRTRRFSLYLSAQLMYGTVKVFFEQNKYLLTDCLEAERKLKKVVVQDLLLIPDAAPLSSRKLCLIEDFSSLTTCVLDDINLNPHIRHSVDLLQESVDLLREAEEHLNQSLEDIVHTRNTAPAHTITMPEFSIETSSSLLNTQFSQVAPELDLPPITAEDLERYYADPPVSPIQHVPDLVSAPGQERIPVSTEPDPANALTEPEPTNLTSEPIMGTIQEELEQTPAIHVDQLERPPSRPGKRPSTFDDGPDVTPARKKSKVSTALVLPPLEGAVGEGRKRRVVRTHLQIDGNKRVDKEVWRDWQENHAATTKPAVLPDSIATVEELMTSPGSQGNFNSIEMRAWFRKLCTMPLLTAVLPVERPSSDETGNITETEFPRLGTSLSNMSRDERLLASHVRSDTVANKSNTSSLHMQTPNATNIHNKSTSRVHRDSSLAERTLLPEAIEEQLPPPEQLHDMQLIEEIPQSMEQNALAIVDEQPLPPEEMQQVLPDVEPYMADPTTRHPIDPTTPALVIDDGTLAPPGTGTQPLTPRTVSAKAKLTRSLKKHFLKEETAIFTDLTDVIQPNKTSRLEVCQLFNALLSMAKRRQVRISQEQSFGPIHITRGDR